MTTQEHTDFTVYSYGICFASVCSSLPQAEVEARMAADTTGISSEWKLSTEPFRSGQPNPCPCEDAPETHTHYLFSC